MRLIRWATGLGACLLVAACGGGEEAPPARAQAPQPMQSEAGAPSAATLMDWAQRSYPAWFPGTPPTTTVEPFTYRYYPQTGNYLGLLGDAVFVYGPVTGQQLLAVGGVSDFTCTIYPERCATAAVPADASGTYTAYAANGERFTLTLDFTQGSFAFGGLTFPVYASSGSFRWAGVDRTYLFDGPTVPNAGFRITRDVVVGSYDFGTGAKPFVAARSFATSFAEAAGTYNTLGVTRTAAGADDSAIYSARIDADGHLLICNDFALYTVALCPAASVLTFTLSLNGDTFTATPASANANGPFNFKVATAGGDRIYLMGAVSNTSPARWFRIGVRESADFPSGTAYGGTTLGEWGLATFTSSSYSSSGIAADGHSVSAGGTLTTLGTIGPTGMRSLRTSGNGGFAIQNTQVAVLVGPRGGTTAGYIQIGGK